MQEITGESSAVLLGQLDELRAQLAAARQATAESDSLLQAILDFTPALIYVKGVDHRYRLANRRYEELNHVRREDVIGKTVYDILPRETADLVRSHDQRVIDTQAATEWEELLPTDDGIHTYLSQRFPLFDREGRLTGVCGISTDISDRAAREHQRAEELLSLRTLVAEAPVGVSIIDAHTSEMLMVNAEAQRLHGFQHESSFGWSAYEQAFVRRRPDGSVYRRDELPLRRALMGETVTGEEMWWEFPDGRREHVVVSDMLVYGDDGRLTAVIATIRDLNRAAPQALTIAQDLRVSQITSAFTRSGRPISASLSVRGTTREVNEDSTYCEPDDSSRAALKGWLYTIADGMGGAAMGEVASQTAVRALVDSYYASEGGSRALVDAVLRANEAVLTTGRSQPQYRGMGTTLTAALIRGNRLTIAYAGDTRAYQIRHGAIRQLSQDHTWVAELVRAGALTPEQLKTFRYKNIVTRSLGRDQPLQVGQVEEQFETGDIVLLCSDGLHGTVDDSVIARIASTVPPQEAAATLANLAQRNGSEDDTSVLIVRWQGTA